MLATFYEVAQFTVFAFFLFLAVCIVTDLCLLLNK